MRQLLSTIAYCHRKNVCHRDLKPENVLVDKDLNVKLVDFGTSQVLSSGGEKLKQTLGTAYYVAPEVILGSYD